ncbi:MAG: CBS domain-containing protein [Paracoccaceae bacterium]|tara:strand:+ start:213 stop:647 length:435 start_codon:yes stop_codon:yes gene_type:complete
MSKSLAIKLSERELITVDENDQLLEAIKKLAKYNIGAIPVLNSDKQLAGIISERDIVKELAKNENMDCSILFVNQLMTKKVIYCENDVLSDKLMELMTKNKVRHIPIVNKNNYPIGIVSIGDVVNRLIEKIEYENKMLKDFVSG